MKKKYVLTSIFLNLFIPITNWRCKKKMEKLLHTPRPNELLKRLRGESTNV